MTFSHREQRAKGLWQDGQLAEMNGRFQEAYELFTTAHDTVLDCAALHRHAHQHLYRINRKTGNHRELAEDWLLLNVLGPMGFFAAFAYVTRQRKRYAE